jgi:CMP/dCMP kinase
VYHYLSKRSCRDMWKNRPDNAEGLIIIQTGIIHAEDSNRVFRDEDDKHKALRHQCGGFWYTTRMIISIHGKEGSGKTTIAKMLADTFGYKRYYIGGMRREAARKIGMTLEEYNTWSETHPQGDKEFDEYLTKLGKTENNFIIETRTAFHFIPKSIKIYLDVSESVAAHRIFNDKKLKERNERTKIQSIEEITEGIRKRRQSDIRRYEKYYKLDIHNPSHYDLVVQTDDLSVQQAFERIVSFLKTKKGLTSD